MGPTSTGYLSKNEIGDQMSEHQKSEVNVSRCMLVLFAGLVLCAGSVCAGPVLNDPEIWANVPSLEGWTNALPYGQETATLSNPSNYLRITFAQQSGQPQMETDTIYTEGGEHIGNYQIASLFLRFDFYAEDVLPLSSTLYLHSAVRDTTWEYVFANTAVDTWTPHDVSFLYSPDWSGLGGASEFWADLADIDRIGISVVRDWPNAAQQDYGLDNWEYYAIPEPNTFAVLTAAFLSLGLTFRRRLKRGAKLQ